MAATPWASDRNWELVFEDNFDGSSLNAHNWSRIDYVGYNAPDWRKYQSRDESLVEFREKDGNSAMTLWGKYGDYTTQTNQTAPARTYACGGSPQSSMRRWMRMSSSNDPVHVVVVAPPEKR